MKILFSYCKYTYFIAKNVFFKKKDKQPQPKCLHLKLFEAYAFYDCIKNLGKTPIMDTYPYVWMSFSK